MQNKRVVVGMNQMLYSEMVEKYTVITHLTEEDTTDSRLYGLPILQGFDVPFIYNGDIRYRKPTYVRFRDGIHKYEGLVLLQDAIKLFKIIGWSEEKSMPVGWGNRVPLFDGYTFPYYNDGILEYSTSQLVMLVGKQILGGTAVIPISLLKHYFKICGTTGDGHKYAVMNNLPIIDGFLRPILNYGIPRYETSEVYDILSR